jgi:CheY-like chemotaxis protein
MINRSILLIDSDPKNLRILLNNFVEAKFEADQATTDAEAFKKLKEKQYDLVISDVAGPGIDGYRLLEHMQREFVEEQIPVVFLTQKSDIYHRVKSFKLGVKDYIVKPIHVKEILARIEMLLSRLARRREEATIAKKKFVGRLEDLVLAELIEAFGVERKSGILSLFNENGLSGQVFFKNGCVINAATASLKVEDAIYKMMSWHKGRFSMLFCDVEVADEIGASNMGLLLQGAKMMEDRAELLGQLPSLDAVLITTVNFKKIISKKDLANDLDEFIALFDGERSLARIIDESPYDEITALKRILKLYRLGFLHVLKDFAGDPLQKTSVMEDTFEPVTSEMLKDEEESIPDLKRTNSIEDDAQPNEEINEELPTVLPGRNANTSTFKDDPDEQPESPHPLRKASHFGFKSPTKTFDKLGLHIDEDFVGKETEKPDEDEKQEYIPESYITGSMEEVEPLGPIEEVIGEENEFKDEQSYELESELETDKEGALEESFSEEWKDDLTENEDFSGLLGKSHPADALLEVDEDEIDFETEEEPEWSRPNLIRQGASIGEGETESVAPMPAEEKTEYNEETDVKALFRKAKGSILVLGADASERMKIVDILATGRTREIKATSSELSDIYYGTAEFLGGHLLNLISLTIEKEFTPLLDYFSKTVLGYVLLINPAGTDWNYYSYLIKVLREKLHAPGMIVIRSNNGNANYLNAAKFRAKLSLQENEGIQVCGELDQINAKRIIFSLFEPYQKKRKGRGSANQKMVTPA